MARQSKTNRGSTRVYAPTHFQEAAEVMEKPPKTKAAGGGKKGAGNKKSVPKKNSKKAKRGGKSNSDAVKPKANAVHQETIMVPIELLGALGSKVVTQEDKPKEGKSKKRAKRKAAPKTIFNEPASKEPKREAKAEGLAAKRTLSVLIALVILAGMAAMGYFLLLVDEITITGNQKYSSDLIRELSGLELGRHILLSDTNKAAANIESTAYIKVLEVKREFPRAIRINVAEREEAAVITGQSYDVIIDIEGHVLSIGAASDTEGLLRVVGMSQHGFSVNQSVGTAGDVQAATLKLILLNLSELELMGEVTELNLSNPLRVSLKTTSGVDVLLGQADGLEEKLLWMRDTLPSLNAANIKGGTLDVGAKGGPIYSPPGAGVSHDDDGLQTDGDDGEDDEDTGSGEGGDDPGADPGVSE